MWAPVGFHVIVAHSQPKPGGSPKPLAESGFFQEASVPFPLSQKKACKGKAVRHSTEP